MEDERDKFVVTEDELLFFVDGKWVRLDDLQSGDGNSEG